MGMPSNLFNTAFKQQRLGLMFSIILVILVYLGTLAMAAQAVLARTALTWGYDLQSRVTIEIPFVDDEDATQKQDKRERLLQLLRAMPQVDTVEPIDEAKTQGLLSQWIDDASLLQALPLPQLIDVTFKVGATLAPAELQRTLASHNRDLRVYGHADWMDKLLGFLTGLGVIATLMLFLTGFAVVTVISAICRAALAVQHDTIELLHFMGAPDHAIARQFQKHIQRLAFPAALIGFALAALTVAILVFLLSSLGGLSLIAPLSWVTLGSVTALIPLGAIGLSIITARQSLLRLLRRLG
ncbi:MAG TPA: hypothetical protein DCY07_05570 [Rhodospirillaceae bacterium]|nr:hypothetical protein [Rhodospirillaceae bacterium]